MNIDNYPLCWPDGQPRTPRHLREDGTFKGTLDAVRHELLDEIDRLIVGKVNPNGNLGVIISTNMPLRRDGGINASASAPADPGVAVYFTRKKVPMCFACDRYNAVWKNLRAIQKTIEAMRGIERWGSSDMMERAFTGFAALPAPGSRKWWEVMGIYRTATTEEIKTQYRVLAKTRHPDVGGSAEAFTELGTAYQQALEERGAA